MVSCTLEGFLKPSSQCSYVLFVFCNYSCIINVLNKFKHFLPLKNLFEFILYDINQKCSLLHWVISLANLPSTDTGSLYQQHKSWLAIALLNSPLVNNIWFWNIPFHHKDSSITLQLSIESIFNHVLLFYLGGYTTVKSVYHYLSSCFVKLNSLI